MALLGFTDQAEAKKYHREYTASGIQVTPLQYDDRRREYFFETVPQYVPDTCPACGHDREGLGYDDHKRMWH